MGSPRKRRVGVAITTELACYRDMIRGISTYAATRSDWQVELLGAYEDIERVAAFEKLNGFILGGTKDLAAVKRIADTADGRVVGIGAQFSYYGLKGLTETESDDLAVGRLAAENLKAKGFRNYAFVGTDTEWSELRQRGFCQALSGHDVSVLMPETHTATDSRGWRMPHFGPAVASWLRHLPKPVALFACNDLRGRALIDLCRAQRIRVPDDVSILAVDNDDLICDLSQPKLSSVVIPWKKIGYRAAETLEGLYSRRKHRPERILVGPETVIERHSTDTLAISDTEIASALRFIREHAHEPIGVQDMLEYLPLSRRSLERRFRQCIGRSPLEEIRRAHTERAKYLLVETELPMSIIAERSGFSTAAWLSKVFRDLEGETPTEYRRRFQVTSPRL